jgi:hypothetical protein
MPNHTPNTRDRKQAWCTYGLADSPADVRMSERRLSRELGHEPSLRDVVEDLMARHHIARPFTGEHPVPTRPSHDTGAR